MGNVVTQAKLATQSAVNPGQVAIDLALFDSAGAPVTLGGTYTDTQARNAIKTKTEVNAVTAVTAANAAAAAGANPTKAEYDVVVTELNSVKAQLNALIAALKA